MVIEFGPHGHLVCSSAIPPLPGYGCVMSSPCVNCVSILDVSLIFICRRPTIDHDQPISLQNSRERAGLYVTLSALLISPVFNAIAFRFKCHWIFIVRTSVLLLHLC
jgi:hypothetical protein